MFSGRAKIDAILFEFLEFVPDRPGICQKLGRSLAAFLQTACACSPGSVGCSHAVVSAHRRASPKAAALWSFFELVEQPR